MSSRFRIVEWHSNNIKTRLISSLIFFTDHVEIMKILLGYGAPIVSSSMYPAITVRLLPTKLYLCYTLGQCHIRGGIPQCANQLGRALINR